MDLAERAALALRRTRAADPAINELTPDPISWGHRARLARTLSAALGVDPADIVVTEDPVRRYGVHPGYLVTVHAHDTLYRFIPELGVHGTFLLLRPCWGCGNEVPVAAIASLVDLGRYLDGMPGEGALFSQYFDWDPARAPDCRHYQPHRG